jgi:multidrug efflux system membrane fusion protein
MRGALPLALLVAGCGRGKGEAGAGGDTVPVVAATTAVATVGPFPITVPVLGTVVVGPGHEAALAAPAPTRVVQVLVSTGDRVVPGQPLVALDSTVFAAEVRRTRVARVTAQRGYDRASRLAAAGILPRKDAESAAAALADATAAEIQARHTLGLAVLRSPIAGVVSAVGARLNAPADPAQTLVQVVDPAGLEIRLTVPPDQAAQVRQGQPVHLSAGRAEGGPVLGEGVVTGVSAAIDSVSGSVEVRAALARPVAALFSGQDVFASIQVAVHPAAVTVPAVAVVPAGSGYQVFVVDTAGTAHARPVTVGARHRDRVEITRGLAGGETVAAVGAYGVKDGAKIRRSGR